MQNLIVHLGSATTLSSRAGPRTPTLSSMPADRPAPPVSDTTAQHYVAAHPSALSLPALSGRHARTRRTSPASAALGPLPGDVHWSGPGRVAPPRPGPPPFPSSFTLSRCRSLPAHAAPLVPPSPLLSDSFSRAPELPHRSLHLDPSGHRQPPLPRRFRPSTAVVRPSPVSSSPSYQSPKFLANPSFPRLSRAAGLHHPRRRPPETPPR
jgi:hypothetical protein